MSAAGPKATVLVHCQGGSGRTGTMAAACRVAKGLTVDEAITRVRRVRPTVIETGEQKALLHQFGARVAQA